MEKEKKGELDKKLKETMPEEQVEIISPEKSGGQVIVERREEEGSDSVVSIDKEKVQVKKSGNLVVGNLNLVLSPFRKRREKYYRDNPWHLVLDIALVLVVGILFLLLVFFNEWRYKSGVSLNIINNNQEINSGSLSSFELEYQVKKKAEDSLVKLILPENFIIESVSPNNLFNPENKTFRLGDLEDGDLGKIKVNGYVLGDSNDHQMIAFKFFCKQCPKNGTGSSLFYNIDHSIVDFSYQVPETLYLNSDFEGVIELKNNSNSVLRDLSLSLGPNLELKRANWPVKEGRIIIDKISEYGREKIEFWASPRKDSVASIQPELNLNLSQHSFSSYGPEKSFSVKEPGLKVSLTSNKNISRLNEVIVYNLNFENNEEETIKNIEINLSSANPNFSLKSVHSKDLRNARKDGQSIIINDLVAGESGSLSIEASFEQRQIVANQDLSLKANLNYLLGEQNVHYGLESNKTKISSSISASANAYYYSPQGDQLGVGLLPPAVDMATNYWIFLEFNNSGNNLENFVLSAELPDNVYFSDNKRVLDGQLMFAEVGKRLIWEIPEINGGANKLRANFELTLIPELKDLGSTPTLLENIKLTVKDIFTEEDLSYQLSPVNTDLKNDRLSSGKGRVVNFR